MSTADELSATGEEASTTGEEASTTGEVSGEVTADETVVPVSNGESVREKDFYLHPHCIKLVSYLVVIKINGILI